jgi:beta-amylase
MNRSVLACVLCSVLMMAGVSSYVPVFVMLPLDTINNNNQVSNPQQILSWMKQLKSGGVDGVMVDVWWGLVEKSTPQVYDWTAYQELVGLVKEAGLQMQVVMSFHQCGGNVGDTCDVKLPSWATGAAPTNEIFYTDREGHSDEEYLSLSADTVKVFPTRYGGKRTGLDVYSDFMESFAKNFTSVLGSVIVEVQVGLGPAGEMRYPSYQLAGGLWSFPGIGEFQCYDKYMLQSLVDAASKSGHADWGNGGPSNAGTYKNVPSNTGFFTGSGNDNFKSAYGDFFLSWYSQQLIDHGDRVLSQAHDIFSSFSGLHLAAKVAGIHWWYMDESHAAELTAGYYNIYGKDGYGPISQMFNSHGASFDCMSCMPFHSFSLILMDG